MYLYIQGQSKDWEDGNNTVAASQAFSNLAALAQLDEMNDKKENTNIPNHQIINIAAHIKLASF